MNYLLAENLSKSFGDRVLFRDLTFSIEDGQRIALIARNGSGKTTLLRILAGKDIPDTGTVRLNKDTRMGYLAQEPELNDEQTVLESVLSEGNRLAEAVRRYELALEAQADTDNPDAYKALEQATTDMEHLNAWDYELKIRQILSRLKITRLNQKVGTLSGGQKKRVALARVLIEEPELLLLDEPTNHLDVDMVEWLEEYLSRQTNQSLLLITHDRYFMDRVTTEVMELEDGQLYRNKGGYQEYLESKSIREESQAATVEKSKNLLRKELEWMRRQPKARTTKSKSRIDAFYDLEEKAKQKTAEEGVRLQVRMQRLGGKILELEDVNKRFDDVVILDHFSYTFQKRERIGVVGPNGVGKTTFLELITGKIQPDSGRITTGETVVYGYYTQAGIHLPEDKRAIEVVTDIAEVIPMGNGETISASQFLQRFGFEPARQYTYVSKLSGGEKRRLHLLTVLVKNPNFLILDEPTNDLDIPTLATLEEFLQDFPGCLIIVSHDRFFMDKLADHLFVFQGQGKIRDYNGTFSEFREVAELEEKLAKTAAKPAPPVPLSPPQPKEEKKKISFKEQKEYQQLEAEIPQLEERITALQEKMAAGQGSNEDYAKWNKELNSLQQELDTKTDRWMELGEYM